MRPSNFIGFLTCAFSLFFAVFFLEGYQQLLPCPLCILDRIVLVVMGVFFIMGLFTDRIRPRLALFALNVVAVSFGFLFAGRHVWVQNQPFDTSSACLSEEPVISGITDFLKLAFAAQADCSLIQWTLLGLSIPALTLLLFVFLALLLLAQLWGIKEDSHADSED